MMVFGKAPGMRSGLIDGAGGGLLLLLLLLLTGGA